MIDNLREASKEEFKAFYRGSVPCAHKSEPDLFTSIEAGQRTTYATVIDDILVKLDKRAISGRHVLERLQQKLHCDLTSQRYAIMLLIIERLRKRPVPQTNANFEERDAESFPVMVSKASIAAFNIPELLEAILSHLPMEDLFVSSRVNKTFHRLIATSPTLQRKIFLLPAKSQPQEWQPIRNTANHHVHAVVASSDNDYSALPWPEVVFEKPRIVARLNPLLEPERYECSFTPDPASTPMWNTVYCARLHVRVLASESWPQMYLTDPPCTCAFVDVHFAEKVPTSGIVLRVRRLVRDPAGVTFGAMNDALHARGSVAVYERPEFWDRPELYIVPDTTVSEQPQNPKRKGLALSFNPEKSTVDVCHIGLPSDEEFDEMRRNNRVEGAPSCGVVW